MVWSNGLLRLSVVLKWLQERLNQTCNAQFSLQLKQIFSIYGLPDLMKKDSETAFFLWYDQSRDDGLLIKLISFREKSFFRVSFDTQTIGWL